MHKPLPISLPYISSFFQGVFAWAEFRKSQIIKMPFYTFIENIKSHFNVYHHVRQFLLRNYHWCRLQASLWKHEIGCAAAFGIQTQNYACEAAHHLGAEERTLYRRHFLPSFRGSAHKVIANIVWKSITSGHRQISDAISLRAGASCIYVLLL